MPDSRLGGDASKVRMKGMIRTERESLIGMHHRKGEEDANPV
jgi:hypothetical protein